MLEFVDGLTYDDILVYPQISDIRSRSNVSLKSRLVGNIFLDAPLISANMDTVTELEMAKSMHRLGGVGIIHRFLDPDTQKLMIEQTPGTKIVSVGVKGSDHSRLSFILDESLMPIDAVLIDVAHGHSTLVMNMIDLIKATYPEVYVIAGNVATYEGTMDLLQAGADSVKIGVGPGSACSTRVVAGCGVPQVTAIMDARRAIEDFSRRRNLTGTRKPTLIADGGIRSSGDVFKALVVGADTVMIGKIFGATEESPGLKFNGPNGDRLKEYRGMASDAAQSSIGVKRTPEGIQATLKITGSIDDAFKLIVDGVRSGMSYVGCRDMIDLRSKNIKISRMTQAGFAESVPHANVFRGV